MPRALSTFGAALALPLVMLLLNKVNRTMRIVPSRYWGWAMVASKAWLVWMMAELAWCATTEEQARSLRRAGAELWRRLREGRPVSMGAVPGEAGAAWYLLRPVLPAAVFDPSFVGSETVDVLPGNRVLFRQQTYEVKWVRAAAAGRNVGIARVDPNIGGAVHLSNGGVLPNPAYGSAT